MADFISFLHLGLANITKQSVLSLDDGESKRLAEAASKVLAFHDIPVSPYMVAWTGLLMTAGTIYAPRVAIIAAGRADRRPAAPPPTVQQPSSERTTEAAPGFVTIRDPMGNGGSMRIPAENN